MTKYRGPNRGSFTFGGSPNNTRAERLWPELGSQVVRGWRGFFIRLERLHGLDRDNRQHLWLLHYLFLSPINDDCAKFQHSWNHHPISGKGNDQTPRDMRFLGILKHGLYYDDFDAIHPQVLELYGEHGTPDGFSISSDCLVR
ncbi:hypothetical protein C8F01DRAFT_769419 [Mycena amicta]|nr:hypothetical protein C8F01DRAFT_443465 [Mycena amicta]KAJ7064525.1 hypothetical protein C8F01DRAFT_769419 [Mycena amicta]